MAIRLDDVRGVDLGELPRLRVVRDLVDVDERERAHRVLRQLDRGTELVREARQVDGMAVRRPLDQSNRHVRAREVELDRGLDLAVAGRPDNGEAEVRPGSEAWAWND